MAKTILVKIGGKGETFTRLGTLSATSILFQIVNGNAFILPSNYQAIKLIEI